MMKNREKLTKNERILLNSARIKYVRVACITLPKNRYGLSSLRQIRKRHMSDIHCSQKWMERVHFGVDKCNVPGMRFPGMIGPQLLNALLLTSLQILPPSP